MSPRRQTKCWLCKNSMLKTCYSNQNISYHTFPKKAELRSKWMKICRLQEGLDDPSSLFVCSDHFEPSCFYVGKENAPKRLKPNSVPDVSFKDKTHPRNLHSSNNSQLVSSVLAEEPSTHIEGIVKVEPLAIFEDIDHPEPVASTSKIDASEETSSFEKKVKANNLGGNRIFKTARRSRFVGDFDASNFLTSKIVKKNLSLLKSSFKTLREDLRVAKHEHKQLIEEMRYLQLLKNTPTINKNLGMRMPNKQLW